MQYGKTVRAPQLVAGTRYAMRMWGKEVQYAEVEYLGYGNTAGPVADMSNRKLNTMKADERMHFMGDEGKFAARQVDMCLVIGDAAQRVTFAELLVAPQATPVEEVVAEVQEEAPAPALTRDERIQALMQEHNISRDAARKRVARQDAKAA